MIKLPPPPRTDDKSTMMDWYMRITNLFNKLSNTHNELQDLQGGTSTERYHLSVGKYNAIQSGVSTTITTAKITPGGTDGSMTFTNGILTAQTQAT